MDEMSILKLFPKEMQSYFVIAARKSQTLQEIRIRVGQPVRILRSGAEYVLDNSGTEWLCRPGCAVQKSGKTRVPDYDALCLDSRQLENLFVHMCRYSPYAFGEELRQGFLTVAGGHRIGVAGQVVAEGNSVRTIRNIRFLNIRISHEIKGCADTLVPLLYEEQTSRIYNVLIVSPPGMGKTTILRDIVRQISNGGSGKKGNTVAVIDERSEIAGCFLGEPQNDVGVRTDVLDACPKALGMEMMLRSMSPDVMAVDEIATAEDVTTLLRMMNCGVRVIATVHGESFAEMRAKPYLKPLFEADYFGRFLLLAKGYQKMLYDRKGERLL